jgi:hypothetical protein
MLLLLARIGLAVTADSDFSHETEQGDRENLRNEFEYEQRDCNAENSSCELRGGSVPDEVYRDVVLVHWYFIHLR